MSYLEKYARPQEGKKTRQYSVKLGDGDGREFEEYCKALNIRPGEALRYLVLEELERKRRKGDTQKIPLDTEKLPEVPPPAKKRQPRKTPSSKNQYLTQFKRDGKYPCPICEAWSSSNHFSRHAKGHGYDGSMELLKSHEEAVQAMCDAYDQV